MKKSKKKRKKLSNTKGNKLKTATSILPTIHLDAVENFTGFAVEAAKPGEIFRVQTRGSLVSDDALFYIYIDQITGIFLKNVFVNSIYQFLVLIHDNLSADVYLNNIPTKALMMTKRDFKKGEVIRVNDIADISKLSFEGINIKDTDKVIYCFKVGWKFGLFFDLHGEDGLNIEAMQSELGSLHRYLHFQYVYDVLESDPLFDLLIKDGWFPFIEILGPEFKEIIAAYQNLTDQQSRIEKLISKFDQERIVRISNKWWKKKLFKDKREILETGIDSYLRNDSKGFISCIKTLLPEIEGIIRLHYFEETGKGKGVHVPDLIAYIVDKGRIKSGSDLSLFFPRAFFEYLNKSIFPEFDLEKGDISLSRHTSSHGVARTEEYTNFRALQLILILDQIYFYI